MTTFPYIYLEATGDAQALAELAELFKAISDFKPSTPREFSNNWHDIAINTILSQLWTFIVLMA